MGGYRSTLRDRRAEQTRQRVASAASSLFAAQGYTATSVRQIAATADVSLDTLYACGGKAAVFLLGLELAVDGTADRPLFGPDRQAELAAGPTLDAALHRVAEFVAASHERSAGLWAALEEGARTDGDLAEARGRIAAAQRAEARSLMGALVERGLARPPEDPSRTADLCWAASHAQQHRLLVLDAGWTVAAYRAWLVETYRQRLA